MTNKIVAITGGIGSGKSAVASILKNHGFYTVDCDELAREIASLPQVIDQVGSLLGSEYVVDGKLDRRAIRNVVFNDEQLLNKYNAVFFDGVKQMLAERLKRHRGIAFVEISVFDAFDFAWDEVWLVEADDGNRIARTLIRDGVSEDDVKKIMSRQKICGDCTLKIINNGNLDDLKLQVERAVKTLL